MLRLVGVVAAALVLVACSAQATPPDSSVLEQLPEDGACDLINDATVVKVFGGEVDRKIGMRHGRVASVLTYECDYEMSPTLDIDLSTTFEENSDQEIMDHEFTDRTKEWRPVGETEVVPELGSLARFGQDASYGEYADTWQLCVVFYIRGERLQLDLSTIGTAKLDQLRPLAEEVIRKLAG